MTTKQTPDIYYTNKHGSHRMYSVLHSFIRITSLARLMILFPIGSIYAIQFPIPLPNQSEWYIGIGRFQFIEPNTSSRFLIEAITEPYDSVFRSILPKPWNMAYLCRQTNSRASFGMRTTSRFV